MAVGIGVCMDVDDGMLSRTGLDVTGGPRGSDDLVVRTTYQPL